MVNKWFSLQAGIEDEAAVERVEGLLAHPAFTWSNPNRVRAVLGAFAMMNLVGFHRRDGAGYRLLADKVLELDRSNPQVAARLLSALGRWRRFDAGPPGADAGGAGAGGGRARPVARHLRDREQEPRVTPRPRAGLSRAPGPRSGRQRVRESAA